MNGFWLEWLLLSLFLCTELSVAHFIFTKLSDKTYYYAYMLTFISTVLARTQLPQCLPNVEQVHCMPTAGFRASNTFVHLMLETSCGVNFIIGIF